MSLCIFIILEHHTISGVAFIDEASVVEVDAGAVDEAPSWLPVTLYNITIR